MAVRPAVALGLEVVIGVIQTVSAPRMRCAMALTVARLDLRSHFNARAMLSAATMQGATVDSVLLARLKAIPLACRIMTALTTKCARVLSALLLVMLLGCHTTEHVKDDWPRHSGSIQLAKL